MTGWSCTYLGYEILTIEKKYLGSKIDGKLTYLGSQILRAETKKIFVNELGSLDRKVFQNTIVNKRQIFKKIDQRKFWGASENLVNIFGVFEKFGQNIWGSEKMAWHDHPHHKSQWVPPGIVIFIGQHKECLGKILKKAISHALLLSGSGAYSKESAWPKWS